MVKCYTCTCISLVISNVFIIVYIYIFYIFFLLGGGCLADGLELLICSVPGLPGVVLLDKH